MTHDLLGNPLSTRDPDAVRGINDFISGLLGYNTKITNITTASEQSDDCLVNTYSGFLWMLSETGDVPVQALDYLKKARNTAMAALPREQLALDLLQAWCNNAVDDVFTISDRILRLYPADLVILKVRHYHAFVRGRFGDMLHYALQSVHSMPDNAALYGMLAFAYEQNHRLDLAEQAACRALCLDREEPWSQHALAHVLLTQGRIEEGTQFLEAHSSGWGALTSFMYTHLWWHLALFYLARGRVDDAILVFDNHCWARDRHFSQDQIGAVSLLLRMELAGIDVGTRWKDMGPYLASRSRDVSQPFLTLQYLYGLLRADRPEGNELLEHIRRITAQDVGEDAKTWFEVATPLAHGLAAYARRDHAAALDYFEPVANRLIEIGGSHAQRDLFAQIILDTLIAVGREEQARIMLETRLRADPHDMISKRLSVRLNARSGHSRLEG